MIQSFRSTEKGNCIKGMLIGCALVGVIVAMVMLGTYIYLKKHGAEFFSGLMGDFLNRALAQSTLSEEQQKAIQDQFDRVTEKFKAGEINEEHLTRFGDAFADGDLFHLMILEYVEEKWIPDSGLTEEQKANGALEIQRTKRGLAEGTFTRDQIVYIQKALPMETDAYGNEQLVQEPTDKQLSDLIGDLKIVNDEAEIPEGEYRVDYANYVREMVDEILGEETAPIDITPATGEVMSATADLPSASPAFE